MSNSATTGRDAPLVWDWPLRLFHWLLALCFAASWLTAELGVEYTEWHMRSGYTILGLLVFRLCWGFLGNRYARLSALFPRPQALLAYLRTLPDPHSPAPAGHSPMAALAVWLLLGLLLVQAGSGLFVTDDIIYSGPWQGAVAAGTSEWLTDLHHSNFDWLLAMVGAHLLAMVCYAVFKKHNLVGPMLTGRNPALSVESARPSAWWRVILALAIAGVAIYFLLALAPEPVYDDFY